MTEDEIKEATLLEINKLLKAMGKTLSDYDGMPFPAFDREIHLENRMIINELYYNKHKMKEEHDHLIQRLNADQRFVYDTISDSVTAQKEFVFFVYGYGGIGKTFIWKTLSPLIRSKGQIVSNVASSGIASLLLPGRRMTHSRFAIPIAIHEESTCNIKQGSHLAQLISQSQLIIWDEAPMVNRYYVEALDRTMRDIMQLKDHEFASIPFGGKTIVFDGDFRQILPVILKGSRQIIVGATIDSSYLWNEINVLKLTKNMRLMNMPENSETNEIKNFVEWVAKIGDGTEGTHTEYGSDVQIPDDILLRYEGDPIGAIVNSILLAFDHLVNVNR